MILTQVVSINIDRSKSIKQLNYSLHLNYTTVIIN